MRDLVPKPHLPVPMVPLGHGELALVFFVLNHAVRDAGVVGQNDLHVVPPAQQAVLSSAISPFAAQRRHGLPLFPSLGATRCKHGE
jgi:uncharacterized protein YigA (DUF484 family)